MEETQKKTRTSAAQKLVLEIGNNNEAKTIANIKALQAAGDATIVFPLLQFWNAGVSEDIENELIELFQGLKSTATIPVLMEAFRDESLNTIHRKMVMVFWNSKLDFSAYLSDFVLFAIEGDFMDAFEAVTLIEQFESIISESTIMESQLLLKEYFGGTENRDAKKDTLLSDLTLMVKQFDEETDLD